MWTPTIRWTTGSSIPIVKARESTEACTSTDGPAQVTFYVLVDDIQAYLDKAERLDGKTIAPITESPNVVTFALFADLEGNTIGLVK